MNNSPSVFAIKRAYALGLEDGINMMLETMEEFTEGCREEATKKIKAHSQLFDRETKNGHI